MRCDTEGCPNEATVFETLIRDHKRVEKHLCEECARKEGLVVQQHVPISDLLSKFVAPQPGGVAKPAEKSAECPGCSITWAKFRQSGLLGCPECYRAFEKELSPLIERAHEGATHHAGKTPRRAGASEAAAVAMTRLATIRRQLDEAVASEQYERAARLRDELRRVGAGGESSAGAGSAHGSGPAGGPGAATGSGT